MKSWIVSDLHVDTYDKPTVLQPPDDYDILIVAGDICENMVRGVEWLVSQGLNKKPVLYIAGNHEGYRTTYDGTIRKAKELKAPNIHILNKETITIDGVNFFGATMWTDYNLFFDPELGVLLAQNNMNDHRLIRLEKYNYHKFLPQDAQVENFHTKELLEELDPSHIIITHHAPSIRSVDDKYKKDLLTSAYASNFDELASKFKLWIHGHVHKHNDYMIDNLCRVISNPRGYPSENSSFDPAFVIDIP